MSDQKHSHGPNFQKDVLKLMMTDLNFCLKACATLEAGFFGGELKWFFNKFKQISKDYGGTPRADVIDQEILFHQDKEISIYQEEFKSIQDRVPCVKYIARDLTGFVRSNIFVGAFKSAANEYNSGNKEDAYELTNRKMAELSDANFEDDGVVQFGDHEAVLSEASLQKDGAIPTGIHEIDDAMGGGLFPGTWTTFLGGTNSGKSMLMANLAFHAVQQGRNVFVTVHEDEENPTKLRYLSRFSGIPISKLQQGLSILSAEEKVAVQKADSILRDHVRFKFMYGGDCTIEAVIRDAKILITKWPYQLLLCDYPQCLDTKEKRGLDEIRNRHEHIYHQLKQTCLELNIAGAGPAQANRTGHANAKNGNSFLRMSDVGESFGIAKKSSNFITINRSNAESSMDRVVFVLDKCRNGRADVKVECATDFSKCVTHSELPQNQKRIYDESFISPDSALKFKGGKS